MSSTRERPAFVIKTDSDRPAFSDVLRARDGSPLDLTNATGVRFYMRHRESGDLLVNADGTIDNPTEGVVSYTFTEGQTSRVGTHIAEWVVVWADGGRQKIPADGYRRIDIPKDVARSGTLADLADPDAEVGVLTVTSAVDLVDASITDGTATVWDAVAKQVPAASVEDAWVDESGDMMSGNLNLAGNNLSRANAVVGDDGLFLDMAFGTVGNSIRLRDGDNTDLVAADHGGRVRIPNGPLQAHADIQTPTGTIIWDATAGHVPAGQQEVGYGASGDYVFLGTSSGGTGSLSTTSTTYAEVGAAADHGVVPHNMPVPGNITQRYVSFIGALTNNTAGATTNARLYDATNATALAGTEVSATGTAWTFFHSPLVAYDPGLIWEGSFQLSVSDGTTTGSLAANPTVLVWGAVS